MAARNSSSSYKLGTLVTLLCPYRVISGGSRRSHQASHRNLPSYNSGSQDQGLRFISITATRAYNQPKLGILGKDQTEELQVQPATPFPPKCGYSKWVKWFLASVVSFLLPFWKDKWNNLLTLEGTVEKVVAEVQVAAEVVEKVATTADEALDEVVNQLPDDSKLKGAAQVLEHASSVAAHDAQLIENMINKVDDVKQDLEDLEKMVVPIVDKIMQGKHPKY